ncbi:hypothetical protein G6011_01646 [Alternaria panax]|uniref:Transcription factor domain-containing protein n=1 Tax=Alternaria panax TaxID=48097 RepID=A0AAD4NWJ1_9PLEO|nr:hypothetical protein G6011_01646 [Alternaria panax]
MSQPVQNQPPSVTPVPPTESSPAQPRPARSKNGCNACRYAEIPRYLPPMLIDLGDENSTSKPSQPFITGQGQHQPLFSGPLPLDGYGFGFDLSGPLSLGTWDEAMLLSPSSWPTDTVSFATANTHADPISQPIHQTPPAHRSASQILGVTSAASNGARELPERRPHHPDPASASPFSTEDAPNGPNDDHLLDTFLQMLMPPILTPVEIGPKWASTRAFFATLAAESPIVKSAIMAFAAMQMQRSGLSADVAKADWRPLYDIATRQVSSHLAKTRVVEDVDLRHMLAALFLLTYTDLLTEMLPRAHANLREAYMLIKSADKIKFSVPERRLISWLRLLDARAISTAGGEGLFLADTDETIFDASPAAIPASEPDTPDIEIEEILFDVLYHPGIIFYQKVQSFAGRITRIDPWHRTRGTVQDETDVMAIAAQISKDLHALYGQRPALMDHAVAGNLTEKHLARNLAGALTRSFRTYLANYQASFIHLHRVAYVQYPKTRDVISAIASIKRLTHLMAQTDESLPVNVLWPLLMWGCEEDDIEERRWIVEAIRGLESIATNARATADLLEQVQRRQDEGKRRVDTLTGVKLRDSEECKYCIERKKPCIRGNAFRFRPVTAVKFNAGEDIGSAEQSLEFRVGQQWVDIPSSLHFVEPNKDSGDEEEYETVPECEANPESTRNAVDATSKLRRVNQSLNSASSESELTSSYRDLNTFATVPIPEFDDTTDLPSIHDVLNTNVPPSLVNANSAGSNSASQGTRAVSSINQLANTSYWQPSPRSLQRLSQSPSLSKRSPFRSVNNNQPPYNSTAFSPSSAPTLRWPVNNAHEARLFHHYLFFCTSWIDVCDSRRHFAVEVPKRAAHFPVILNGILSVAARHSWLMGKVVDDVSQSYVDQCLQALIVALEDPLAHWDENFLIAVILLRLHEEMGDADEHCHHLGTARILNSISSFAADGGLRESASWVSLRQHIYVSLTTQKPLNLSLDNYRHSAVFTEFDDESWANRIIFLFAVVLQTVFGGSNNGSENISRDTWKDLSDEVDGWERTKPWTFSAFHIEPDAGDRFEGSWPELLCPQGTVAVGLQYYHLCKILLTIYSPNASLVGLAGVRARKSTDAAIRKHMRITIGYGVSNSHCGNAMFQGSHILSACGAYIIDPREQQACVEYLEQLQKLIGWRTDGVLKDLREQWTI